MASTTYYIRNVAQKTYAGVQSVANGSSEEGYTYSFNNPTQTFSVVKDTANASGDYSITMETLRAINDPTVSLGSNSTVVLSDETQYGTIGWTLEPVGLPSFPNAYLIYQTDAKTSLTYYWTLHSSQSPTTMKLVSKLGGNQASTQYWVLEVSSI